MRRALLLTMIASIAVLTPSCELLDGAGNGVVQRPTLEYKDAALVNYPSTTSLLAYYCPSSVGQAFCTPLLGAAPAKQDLRFDFELRFDVANPNSFAIPTLSMLLATTLFPDRTGITELGATCVQFCNPGDTECDGTGAQDACRADEDTLDSFEDFADAATDQLVNIATGETDPDFGDNLGVRTIPANGSTELRVAFSLGVDPMANVLSNVADEWVTSYVDGNEDPVEIPYSVRGTLWVDVPLNLGRVGLPFGPADSTWTLD